MRLREGEPVASIDGVPLGRLSGAPFEGPGGARYFALRTPRGESLLVPIAALVDEHRGAWRLALPADHAAQLPRIDGAVAPEQARRALEALGGRQGFEPEAVRALLRPEPERDLSEP